MTKLHKSLFALACAASMFSCMKEDMLETNHRVSLTFNVANESSASKATLNENAVEFQAGDQIGVWDGTSMNCFETAAGGANASFSGTAASAASYILVSPYNENYSVNGSVVTYSIPDVQVATPGSADPNALVSMAKVIGSGEVTLYNCVGLIKVVVPDGLVVKEIQVGGGKGSTVGICGSFTFNTINQALNYVDAGSMRTSITLVPQAGQNIIAPGTYYIAVRPNTYAGLTLAYVNADNQLCKRTTANSVAVERNHIRPVGSLNTTNYTAVTGRATLRYAGASPQFTGLIKKLAIGSNEDLAASVTDNVIKKIVFRAHKLPYKAGGTNIQNGPNSDIAILAWIDGDTAYIYTEAPIITLYGSDTNNSADLFRDFAALEEVSFNDVNTMANTSISYMFRNDTKIKKVDFGNADFSNVKDYSFMLANCGKLEYLSFGETSTLATANMTKALKNANGLKYLYFGKNFSLPSNNNTEFMTGTAQLSAPCDLYCSQDMYDALVGTTSAGFNSSYFTYHAL